MKALTIKQPWVHAILQEGKDVENRKWSTNHRGWIAIHAAAKPLSDQKFPGKLRVPDLQTLDFSAVCGVARLSDVVTTSHSKWFHHPDADSTNYGFVLTDITPLKEPIPCPGALKFWTVTAENLREIQRQLPQIDFLND